MSEEASTRSVDRHRDRTPDLEDLFKRIEQQLDGYVLQHSEPDKIGLKERTLVSLINHFDNVRMRHTQPAELKSSAA